MTKDDDGFAFPVMGLDGYIQEGMSLRDWFAGMALQGLAWSALALKEDTGDPMEHKIVPEMVASAAYEVADAMLKERGR